MEVAGLEPVIHGSQHRWSPLEPPPVQLRFAIEAVQPFGPNFPLWTLQSRTRTGQIPDASKALTGFVPSCILCRKMQHNAAGSGGN